MKKKLILLALVLSAAFAAYSQTAKIKWKQIASGTAGQVAIVGTDGNGNWVTPPFPNWSDTTVLIQSKYASSIIDGKTIASGAFSGGNLVLTKTNGTTITIGGWDTRYVQLTEKAAVNGVATLGADGKVPTAQLPALAGRNTFVVGSRAAMLALSSAIKGDFAIRTDTLTGGATFVLQGTDPAVGTNWILLPPTASPVNSVNGQVGAVSLTTDNISQGSTNRYYSDALARAAISSGNSQITYNSSTGVFTLTTTAVTPGTYNTVTVDQFGRVTSASNAAYALSSALGSYYTKTELQTSGSASVHWNNITGKPTNLGVTEKKQEFTGSTSTAITLANVPVFPADILVFLNGVEIALADYSITSNSITLGFTRESSDIITVKYSY
jgi:hypothetical protein